MDIKKFLNLYKKCVQRKQNWERLYRDAMELFMPEREDFYESIAGQKKGRNVYTSSPAIALDKAVNNLHASLTPTHKQWLRYKAGRGIEQANREDANKQLEDVSKVVFDYMLGSNFDLSISEFYKDLFIGTAALLVSGTKQHPLIFTAVPLKELYIGTGPLGVVDKIFRSYKIKLGSIEGTWEDAVIDKELRSMIDNNPEKEVQIVEGTCPKKIKRFNMKTEKTEEIDGFGYYVSFKDKFLVQRDMPINPWVVSRWSVLSGEEYGRGPCVVALNDAKTLNQFIRLHMQNMELAVHSMFTVVDDGVINVKNIRIGPAAMIPVSANDGVYGPSIKPLVVGGNFQVGQMEVQRLETSINSQMYADPLGRIDLPVKTATEMSLRQQELAKRIGSAFGRLQYEMAKPIADLCIYQLDKFGIINMNDFRVDGVNVAVDVVSPLAQSQAQDDINNVMRYTEFAMGTLGPQLALSLIKPEELLDFVGDQLAIPMVLQLSDQDKAAFKGKMQAGEMAQAAQMAQAVGGAANATGQPIQQ